MESLQRKVMKTSLPALMEFSDEESAEDLDNGEVNEDDGQDEDSDE